ncbi:MAG: hypothetical protein MUO58_06905, partial [Anaerolineales bacterium]|nr:hypothetical protein [Anaerolineales bacterium]
MRLRLVSAFPLSVLAPVFLVLLALSFIGRGIDDFYPQLILNSLGCVDCRDEDSIPDHMVVSGLTASNFLSASQLATQVGLEHDLCDNSPNQVALENCQQGTDEWRITKYLGDIEGYASSMSINKGESIDLFVNSNGTDYDIHVFRSGFYQGLGGRKLLSIRKLTGISQPQ